ncbi:diacylglycerol kinase [Streptomyces sp. NPDC007088]|uniref:diacylglycerol kinase n=1 Tax=Streptomyces sp. NPDC007088 TaxID=3364773 RepID=UPI0036A37F8E
MSAPEPAACGAPSLLVLVDPAARRVDGESVRIARDVLGAGAHTKVCLPEGPEEFAHALHRRGARQPVVVGDDRALLRAVSVLHRDRTLGSCVVSLVPVGGGALDLAHALGVPTSTVTAARAVLDGSPSARDLLVDDSDGVVLGRLTVPAPPRETGHAHTAHWLRTCQSLVRTLAARPAASGHHPGHGPETGPYRLRVEADGKILTDLDTPVDAVTITPSVAGLADIEIHRPGTTAGTEPRGGAGTGPWGGAGPRAAAVLTTRARRVTVSGPDFHYRADTLTSGPVRHRTWAVRKAAWTLMLP